MWQALALCAVLQPDLLQQHEGKQRVLLVFAPSACHTSVVEQKREIDRDSQGFAERDLILQVTDDPALRRRFGVNATEFAVVLIGKDGTRKLRREQPVTLRELFALIDEMPMRRREMQERPKR